MLAWIAFIPLIVKTWRAPRNAVAIHFFVAGFCFHLFLLHWLMANVYWAGGWAFMGYVGLCVALAIYWAILGYAWSLTENLAIPIRAIALAAGWVAMEWMQARLFTGFGWSALAYSQGNNANYIQLAAIAGTALPAFGVVLFNAILAGAVFGHVDRVRAMYIATAVGLVTALHIGGYVLKPDVQYGQDPYKLTLIQPDYPLEMKWDDEYTVEMVRNAAEKSRLVAAGNDVDLIVWPESLIMDDIDRPDIWREVTALTLDTNAALFAGSHRTHPETRGSLNSSYLLLPDGTLQAHYDKIHLAPFGEYVPYGEQFPFITKIVPAIGDIRPGNQPVTFNAGGRTFGPLICFEVLFAPMAEQLRDRGADFLVVITNLGWFGASAALPQEFEQARLRAIETRLPVVHCTNTGISGVFDPAGGFTGMHFIFDTGNRVYRLRDDFTPADTVMHRFGGLFDLPLAADRPVHIGETPFACVGIAIFLAALALAAHSRRRAKAAAAE